MGNNIKIAIVILYWNEDACKKEKDSNNIIKYTIKKFKKISKLRIVTKTLFDDNTAYLFFVSQPTKNNNIENKEDSKPINIKLYSKSQIAKLGPHIILTQKR